MNSLVPNCALKPASWRALVLVSFLLWMLANMTTRQTPADELPQLGDRLSDDQVVAFARLALEGMTREYPNKPSHVMTGPDSFQSPKEMHPAF